MADLEPTVLKLTEETLSMSKQLLIYADEGEWDNFENLNTQRQQYLEILNTANVPADLAIEVREKIAQIIEIEGKLREKAQCLKTETSQQLIQLKKGNKAAKAYQGNR